MAPRGRKWTNVEDKKLRELWDLDWPAKDIGAVLDRSDHAINGRRYYLRLKPRFSLDRRYTFRTSVVLDDEMLADLRRVAKDKRQSLPVLIRAAISAYLGQ